MPQFIQGNPVSDAYFQSQTRLSQITAQDAQARQRDQTAEDAEVKRINAERLDRSLGKAFAGAPPPATPGGAATPAQAPAPSAGGFTPAVAPAPPAAATTGGATPPTGLRTVQSSSPAQITGETMMQSPGYRVQGATMLQAELQRKDQAEVAHTTRFLDLAKTNPQMAYAYAQQNGLPVPQGYIEALAHTGLLQTLDREDKRLRAVYGIGTAAADNAGYNTAMTALQTSLIGQMKAFAQQQQQQQPQTGGATPASATPPGGQPQPAVPSTFPSFDTSGVQFPTPRPREKEQIIYGTGGTYAYTPGGSAKPIETPAGDPIVSTRGAGAAGRQSVFQQKYQMYLQTYPGDAQGALNYASGRSQVGPQQEAKWAHQMAIQEARNSMTARMDPDFVVRRQQEILAGWRQPSAAAATPGSSPFPEFPDAQQAPDGSWYVPDPQRPGSFLRIDR